MGDMHGQLEDEPDVPANTKKDLAAVDSSLATSISLWMRKRGKTVRPKLTDEQKQQLKECFELMDQDGSGAIDADELGAAFKLLGIRMKRAELEQLLSEVDHDGSGEVEYLEFLEIMTTTLQRLAEEREADEMHQSEGQVPFALMATAYRRKRLMEGIISGDKEVMSQIAQLSEKQTQEALASQQAAAAAGGRSGSHSYNGGAGAKKTLTSITKRSLARLAAMNVDEGLLSQLTPDERRLLDQVIHKSQLAVKRDTRSTPGVRTTPGLPSTSGAVVAGPRSPSPGLNLEGPSTSASMPAVVRGGAVQGTAAFKKSSREDARLPLITGAKYQHYTHSPTHQQLMEVPQVFGIKFSKFSATGSQSKARGASPVPHLGASLTSSPSGKSA